jgi:HSP20 family molecular chaperone IbpA
MASIMRWDLFEDLARFSGFFFDPFFQDFSEGMERGEALEGGCCAPPAVESYRHDGSYVVKVDLPGVSPKDVHLTYEDGYLTIEGERKRHQEIGESSMLREEVCYGAFRRSLYIPEGIKGDRIKARYHEGVLEVTAPLDEKFLPKKIEVEEVKS